MTQLLEIYLAQGPAPAPPPAGDCAGAEGLDCPSPGILDSVVGAVVDSGIGAVAKAFVESLPPFLKELFTFWMSVPPPDLEARSGPVLLMQGSLHWFTLLVGTVALAIGGARLVLARRVESAVNIASSLGVLFFAACVALPLFNVLLQVGDGFSEWLMNRAAGGSFQQRFDAYLKMDTLNQLGVLSMMLVSGFGVLGAFVQLLCMFLRNAALLVVLGVYPIAAAAAATAAGRSWFQKLTGWIVALVLFKPVASIIYATAFLAIKDRSDALNVVLGVILIVMASLALPALMTLAKPATAAVASGGGGLAGMVGLGASLATGAQAWQGRSSGAGGKSLSSAPSIPPAPSGSNPGTGGGSGGPPPSPPGARPGQGSPGPGGRPPSGGVGAPGVSTGAQGAGQGVGVGVATKAAGPAGAVIAVGKAGLDKLKGAVEDVSDGPSGAGGPR